MMDFLFGNQKLDTKSIINKMKPKNYNQKLILGLLAVDKNLEKNLKTEDKKIFSASEIIEMLNLIVDSSSSFNAIELFIKKYMKKNQTLANNFWSVILQKITPNENMTFEEIKKFRDSILKINLKDFNSPKFGETLLGALSYLANKDNQQSYTDCLEQKSYKNRIKNIKFNVSMSIFYILLQNKKEAYKDFDEIKQLFSEFQITKNNFDAESMFFTFLSKMQDNLLRNIDQVKFVFEKNRLLTGKEKINIDNSNFEKVFSKIDFKNFSLTDLKSIFSYLDFREKINRDNFIFFIRKLLNTKNIRFDNSEDVFDILDKFKVLDEDPYNNLFAYNLFASILKPDSFDLNFVNQMLEKFGLKYAEINFNCFIASLVLIKQNTLDYAVLNKIITEFDLANKIKDEQNIQYFNEVIMNLIKVLKHCSITKLMELVSKNFISDINLLTNKILEMIFIKINDQETINVIERDKNLFRKVFKNFLNLFFASEIKINNQNVNKLIEKIPDSCLDLECLEIIVQKSNIFIANKADRKNTSFLSNIFKKLDKNIFDLVSMRKFIEKHKFSLSIKMLRQIIDYIIASQCNSNSDDIVWIFKQCVSEDKEFKISKNNFLGLVKKINPNNEKIIWADINNLLKKHLENSFFSSSRLNAEEMKLLISKIDFQFSDLGESDQDKIETLRKLCSDKNTFFGEIIRTINNNSIDDMNKFKVLLNICLNLDSNQIDQPKINSQLFSTVIQKFKDVSLSIKDFDDLLNYFGAQESFWDVLKNIFLEQADEEIKIDLDTLLRKIKYGELNQNNLSNFLEKLGDNKLSKTAFKLMINLFPDHSLNLNDFLFMYKNYCLDYIDGGNDEMQSTILKIRDSNEDEILNSVNLETERRKLKKLINDKSSDLLSVRPSDLQQEYSLDTKKSFNDIRKDHYDWYYSLPKEQKHFLKRMYNYKTRYWPTLVKLLTAITFFWFGFIHWSIFLICAAIIIHFTYKTKTKIEQNALVDLYNDKKPYFFINKSKSIKQAEAALNKCPQMINNNNDNIAQINDISA